MSNSYWPISQDVKFNLVMSIQLCSNIWYRLNFYIKKSATHHLTLFKIKLHRMVQLRLLDLPGISVGKVRNWIDCYGKVG